MGGETVNLSFDLNDYLLIWNLLFQTSISNETQRLKEKLWKNYRTFIKHYIKKKLKS